MDHTVKLIILLYYTMKLLLDKLKSLLKDMGEVMHRLLTKLDNLKEMKQEVFSTTL